MDAGNGSNQPQQQRYCPTPIMAPPTVATSPPLMSGGSVIGTMHQPTHHPPPSISPHPSAYYQHHSSGASHYPTPSPTPPPPSPMHHQQYYAPPHSYYAHSGSHQQHQQTAQQSQQTPPQHHAISSANSHVSMNTQSQGGQQTHMMSHASYSHHHAPPPQPQHQTHHQQQQWGAPAPHPQQSHHQSAHYYHQSAHHPPPPPPHQQPQTHQQAAPQQHVYPPPSPSPYSYISPHPAPTPPPPSNPPTHPTQQQQQQHLQQTPVPPPQAQSQQQAPTHALMNLSRFVSQSPSPCPSPRASPSHHPPPQQQQVQQNQTAYAGHIEHHASMNGHPGHSPVMSSPPPPHHNSQQAMSPPPPPHLPTPQSHHHHMNQGQQQIPPQYNMNVNNGTVEKVNSVVNIAKQQSVVDNSSPGMRESHLTFHVDSSGSSNSNASMNPKTHHHHQQDHLSSSVPYSTSETANIMQTPVTNSQFTISGDQAREYNSWSESEKKKASSAHLNQQMTVVANALTSVALTMGQQDNNSPSIIDDSRALTPDYLKSNGNVSGGEAEGLSTPVAISESSRTSMSPQPRSHESPSSSGNGHQMMPVRLQNMQKGARTKASMKKLMQEQHIATPNGQANDALLLDSNSAKDMDPEIGMPTAPTTGVGKKSQKSPRKKKSQTKGDNDVSALELEPSAIDFNSTPISTDTPVIRPGYTKSGKKIGRPRKDPSLTGLPPAPKVKGKKGKKASESSLNESTPVASTANISNDVVGMQIADALPEAIGTISGESNLAPAAIPVNPAPKKGKGGKGRKRTSEVLDDSIVSEQSVVDLNLSSQLPVSLSTPANESISSTSVGGKRRKKSKVASDDSLTEPISKIQANAEISLKEAKDTALRLRVIQPTAPPSTSPTKGKKTKGRRQTKADVSEEVKKPKGSPKRNKSNAEPEPPASMPFSDTDDAVTIETGELPRLRSRSPKQRESPTLRISSPRAAKERSTTPSSTNPGSTPTRSRASKEKEVVIGAPVPLSSPAVRSPKKGSDRGSTKGSPKKNQVLTENMEEEEILRTPSSKRTRQLSKESSDTGENQVGYRKSRQNDLRSSIDSDNSLLSPSLGRRASRRKSGSVSGSTDDLSSPGFKTPNSTEIPTPIDTTGIFIPTTSLDIGDSSTALMPPTSLSQPLHTSTPMPVVSKRGKTKKSKASSKSRKSKLSAKSKVSLNSTVAIVDNTTVGNSVWDFESEDANESVPTTTLGLQRPTKQRAKKGAGKKGSKRNSSIEISTTEVEATVDTPSDLPVATTTPLPAKRKGRKSSKSKVQKPKSKTAAAAPVLSIPKPAPIVPKKKGRPSTGKAKVTKAAAATFKQNFENPTVSEGGTSEAESYPFQPPAELIQTKRRRSSVASSVNTQLSSAKSGITASSVEDDNQTGLTSTSQSSQNTKVHRRNSSSLSRDYDVSVVLTDIAHSWSGDRSLSTNLTPQSAVNNSTVFQPSNSLVGSGVTGKAGNVKTSDGASSDNDIREDFANILHISKKRQSKKGSKVSNTEQKTPKKRGKGKKKSDGEINTEAESEVAQILLNLNTEISSKSPSPAKSTPESAPKKARKPRKLKITKNQPSTSTTQSVDNITVGDLPQQQKLSSLETNGAFTNVSSTKIGKRKKAIKRRLSQTKLSKSEASMADISSSARGSESLQFQVTPTAHPTSVKVTKTVKIPTAESLEDAGESVVTSPELSVLSTPKKKTGKATKRKAHQSPDITDLSKASDSVKPPAVKKSRKLSKPSAKATTLPDSMTTDQETGGAVLSGSEVPLKKKRQRKTKNTEQNNQALVKPTSNLFSYSANSLLQNIRPTVFAKSVPGLIVDKDEDNQQKKKSQDAPTLRVIGGKTKFYRGGEEEEVDQDPKLPKEKGPVQTDNNVPWECSFCHLGPHAQKLGDLFGPYFANLPSIYGKPSMKRETWMHGDCALWAGRLILVGPYLRRLEETLLNADKETCTICQRTGATIGCLRRGCKQAVHYPCAIRRFWKMDSQNFHSYCPLHKP